MEMELLDQQTQCKINPGLRTISRFLCQRANGNLVDETSHEEIHTSFRLREGV